MGQIQHKFIEVQGLKLHVAEIGSGPNVVVFLHGFSEMWYSWWHQMVAVVEAGYCAPAPDYRGYRLFDPPLKPEKASFGGLCDGPSDGARGAGMAMHSRLGPRMNLDGQKLILGALMLKQSCAIYILFSRSELPIAAENQEIMDIVDPSTPLSSWFTEGDLEEYSSLYQKSGFHNTSNDIVLYAWSFKEDMGITDFIIEVPALLVVGGKNYVVKFPGIKEYIRSGKVKDFVPRLEIVFSPEGMHFMQEQSLGEVTQLIIKLLKKHI
ncbi:uncharacterized protein LOC104442656 [Eucalyptus grandis]|uniref:uncharacterized protein LOC104442656 n=1 Tax=Eucalyptus grandis TaxID=71139 RepID=UPI00192E7793|nr:uncharacterized protein LOC104442656 [Eucalyptus grandis]